jgi:inner membrane protein
MFVGHAPAGYLLTGWIGQRWPTAFQFLPRRSLLALGILASLLPDLDLLYFYTVDNRQHLHHSYWTHIPAFWLVVFGSLVTAGLALRSAKTVHLSLLTAVNVYAHLALDTVAGKIRWLYPFSSQDIVLVSVPATHGWWVLNFVLHWTFALEIALVLIALVASQKSGRKGPRSGLS